MNAILRYPTNLAAELHQMKLEVESHRQEIAVEAAAFERTRTVWAAQESDVTRRINALRLRLANLLA